MAKTRKPAKGKATKVDAIVEDAIVENTDETSVTDAEVPEAAPDVLDEGAKEIVAEEVEVVSDEDTPPQAEEDNAEVEPIPAESEPSDGAPDTSPSPAPQPAPAQKTGFMPMLLGGAIAAGLGFGAARYPDQWPFVMTPAEDPVVGELTLVNEKLATVTARSDEQTAMLSALQARLDDTAALDAVSAELSAGTKALEEKLAELDAKIAGLESRIHTVEKLPQGSGMEAAAAAASAYERELQQMRQMLDSELAQINAAKDAAATLQVDAAQSAKAAGARAALARVVSALDTGRPFADALFDLTSQAGVDAPAALSAVADSGVPTLADITSSYPVAARAALDASIRASVEAGSMDRMTAFLRTQLGARSLSPKEGDDPDAILSRAEAALKDGNIRASIAELDTLPDAGKPAFADWISLASARADALDASRALADQVNSN